jgi:hypothetical protein
VPVVEGGTVRVMLRSRSLNVGQNLTVVREFQNFSPYNLQGLLGTSNVVPVRTRIYPARIRIDIPDFFVGDAFLNSQTCHRLIVSSLGPNRRWNSITSTRAELCYHQRSSCLDATRSITRTARSLTTRSNNNLRFWTCLYKN